MEFSLPTYKQLCTMATCPRDVLGRLEARAIAADVFYAIALPVVLEAWREELPVDRVEDLKANLRRGAKSAADWLTALPTDELEVRTWWSIEPYWEAPVASVPIPGELTDLQLRAYRWAGSMAAHQLRACIETMHGAEDLNTRDENMPAINHGLRNKIFTAFLQQPELAWRLSLLPLTILAGYEINGFNRATLPAIAR